MEKQFTAENFSKEILNSETPVLVDFYADWCGPCRMMAPLVQEMAEKYDGRIKVGKVNTDQQPDLAALFGVMSIPSFFFIKNGKVAGSSVGMMSKSEMTAKLDSLLQ